MSSSLESLRMLGRDWRPWRWGSIALGTLVLLWAISCFVSSSGSHSDSASTKAISDVRALASAVNLFVLDHERLPTELEELVYPPPGTVSLYVAALPADQWGRPYHYATRQPAHVQEVLPFYVWSNGADGLVGGTGFNCDTGNWSREDRCYGSPSGAWCGVR
ncbi:MAG: type II secretion system protein GspG [Pseudomonadota bacterium]